jgi:hypothetical protein
LLVLAVLYLAAAGALILWLRPYGTRARPRLELQAADAPDAPQVAPQQPLSSDASR